MPVTAGDVLRYLAQGRGEGADALLPLAEQALLQIRPAVEFRVLYRRLNIELMEDGIAAGGVVFTSRGLRRRMEGCTEALFFAATLGAGVDRLIARESLLEMSRALALTAAANAILEDGLCAWRSEVGSELSQHGRTLTPRYCPGYGDWDLNDLAPVLQLAQARRIGLTLTENAMLVPAKSVAGTMGIYEGLRNARQNQCAECGMISCGFRKESL